MKQLCLFEDEEWRDVVGWEGLYQVSNLGNVRSLNYRHTGNTKNLCIKTKKDGYSYVHIDVYKTVHRIVAQAFIPNPQNLPEVNHKNEIKSDNRVENLEWCDRKYNMNYGTNRAKFSNTVSIRVNQYTMNGEFVREWKSAIEAQKFGGFCACRICWCCRGKTKQHKGYLWKYA